MRNFIRVLVYFVSFVAVGAVAAFLVYRIYHFDKTGEVPVLIGKNVMEATELLNKRKLFLDVEGRESHGELEEGLIIRQSVEPGREIPVGTEVGVVVSSGREVYSMPSFEGQPLEDAEITLRNLGMEIGKITRVHSDSVREGNIIAQRPLPGNINSNVINFLVSLGPYPVSYKCPSFVNMTIDDARLLAGELGLRLIEKEEGRRVIFQKPEAESIIQKGDAVEVTLGRGWGMWF